MVPLAAPGKCILVRAADPVILRHVLAGARHRFGAIERIERGVDEAPAHGGVFQLLPAPEGASRDYGRGFWSQQWLGFKRLLGRA